MAYFHVSWILESRIDSCSCVVVSCLSPTEEPRQTKSRRGQTFTHQQNSQHHFRESIMVVRKTKPPLTTPWEKKKQQKNGVKQAWDIIRDFELLQFFMRACALNDPGRIKNWNQKILVSVWLCVQVQQRFLNMRRASNPCDHTSAGSPSDFSQMTTKRIEVFENNSWRLMCSSRIGTSQGWKHFNHTHKTGYLYLVGVLFKISDEHLPPRGTRLQQQQQQRDQGRVFRKPVKPRVKR